MYTLKELEAAAITDELDFDTILNNMLNSEGIDPYETQLLSLRDSINKIRLDKPQLINYNKKGDIFNIYKVMLDILKVNIPNIPENERDIRFNITVNLLVKLFNSYKQQALKPEIIYSYDLRDMFNTPFKYNTYKIIMDIFLYLSDVNTRPTNIIKINLVKRLNRSVIDLDSDTIKRLLKYFQGI